MLSIDSARQKYMPESISWLFIAEAPPAVDSGRFFYFEHVPKGDSLYLELMKVLYPDEWESVPCLRGKKSRFLRRFQNDGCYLMDASNTPMLDTRPAAKCAQLKSQLPALLASIESMQLDHAKVILISATVYAVCSASLREICNVINNESIEFPGSGQQKKFRAKLSRLLLAHGGRPISPNR